MSDEHLKRALEAHGGDLGALERELASLKRQERQQRAAEREQSSQVRDVVLSAQNLKKTYKSKVPVVAVNDVSFNIHRGEIVSLIGPSGSGKSTVLNLLSGLDRPDSGTVTISGTNLTKLNRNKCAAFRSRYIGFVFQFFYLQPFLTLEKNLQIPLAFQQEATVTRHARPAETRRLLEAVGLLDRANHFPKELSGGQMQRAAIARALMNKPKLVFADEPTGNLDRENSRQVLQLFDRIRKETGTAILIVTHDPEVAAFSDHAIELIDGKVA